jgi:transposase-like protein
MSDESKDHGPTAGHTPAEAAFAEKCREDWEDWEAENWGIGPYCRECGNHDREKFACIDNFANGTRWRCKVCGYEFHTAPKPPEE